MLNVIRSYLVSLGFHTDESSFNSAKGSMDKMGKVVSTFSDASVLKFATASAAVTGFVTAAGTALYQFTVGVANADLQNQIFARKMWMSTDAAVAYKSSLNALGASINDLYLSPELMSKFKTLQAQSGQMAPPGGFENSMKGVRDITFEFQRLKLEASYATYWVGYYLTKYLDGPLFGVKGGLKGINDAITANMPKWTAKVAEFIAVFGRLGNAAYLAGKEIKSIWDGLGKSTKEVIGTTAGFFALLKMGPVGMFIAGLTALLLLLDDFYTYERGGKSAFPKLWEWVDKLKKSMDDKGTLQDFKRSLDELAQSMKDSNKTFNDLLKDLTGLDGSKDVVIKAVDLITGSFSALAAVLDSVIGSLKDIRGWSVGNKEEQQQGVAQRNRGFSNFIKQFDDGGKLHVPRLDELFPNLFPPHPPNKYAAGTNDAPGGMAIVGDGGGPELVNLPKGSQVMPNMDLTALLTGIKNMANVMGQFGSGFNPAYMYRHHVTGDTNINIKLSPTNTIHGATNPQAVAKAIDHTNTGLLMRSLQGVIV